MSCKAIKYLITARCDGYVLSILLHVIVQGSCREWMPETSFWANVRISAARA